MAETEITYETYLKVKSKLDALAEPMGFEIHPFKVGWYNELVKPQFFLQYSEETLGFVVLSLPSMFQKTFIPYLRINRCSEHRDPIDDCIVKVFQIFQEDLSAYGCLAIHDFELLPNRRPRILAQTAAHASGAAYYYQRTDVKLQPWTPKQHIYGVCIHPNYGGWFAIRGVLILSKVCFPGLLRKEPKPVLQAEQDIVQLLEDFNFSWQDWKYRDAVKPMERYSEKQKLYFSTCPADRHSIIEEIVLLS